MDTIIHKIIKLQIALFFLVSYNLVKMMKPKLLRVEKIDSAPCAVIGGFDD